MTMLTNTESAKTTTKTSVVNKNSIPQDKFVLGDSECCFEAAKYLTGKLDPPAVKRLFANVKTAIHPSQGKSLKVHFEVENNNKDVKNEIKFVGFITASDASLTLDETDIDRINKYIDDGDIIRATNVDDMVSMF